MTPNPGAIVRCSRASHRTPHAQEPTERTSDMRIRTIAAVAALTIAGTPFPASADHVDPETVKARIMDVFGPTAGPHAIRIARCESRFNPHAVGSNRNGTRDYGVFQLNSGGTMQSLGLTARTALHWETNIAAAHRLYRRRGWQPWVCSGRSR